MGSVVTEKRECSDEKKRGVAIIRGRQDEGMIFG